MLMKLARTGLATSLTLATLASCGGRTETQAEAPPEEDDDGPPIVPPVGPAEALDVLFVVDNGFAGGAAQQVLSKTIPYMVDRLVNPRCVNGRGQIVDSPPNLQAPCEVGLRDFAPQTNVRFGVLSSSIGGHGADSCSPVAPDYDVTQDDGARLLVRDPDEGVVSTYQSQGFLAWDPNAEAAPPGEGNQASLSRSLRALVEGAGTNGCSFNAPLEAAYRFLVDPEPPVSVQVVNGVAVRQGLDTALLEQRDAFLRPQSALLVVVVSDRDDCSLREEGQFYTAAQRQLNGQPFHLPPARSECATDPEDTCCRSCGELRRNGCPADPSCNGDPLPPSLDPLGLRCFDQKRRFGIDFNYPLERYLDGFASPTVADERGELVPNPLLARGRPADRVMVATLTGVPWPDIAIAPNQLSAGLDPATEVDWSRLLPNGDDPPSDPLMIPSVAPRTGTNPITDDELAPPSAGPLANPINGHEHGLPSTPQFACIYPIDPIFNCGGGRCECGVPELSTQNPVCQDPVSGQYDQLQRFGRATPAPRLLELARQLGPQGILGTLCTSDETAPSAPSFGFKPSVDAMMRGIRRHLVPNEDGVQ